jgi:hypothetical protein
MLVMESKLVGLRRPEEVFNSQNGIRILEETVGFEPPACPANKMRRPCFIQYQNGVHARQEGQVTVFKHSPGIRITSVPVSGDTKALITTGFHE